jgi:hypothetical protein
MTASIPASQLVNVIPGVLSAGGSPLALNAVYLTSDPSIPIGTVQPFASAAAVSAWFGPSAPETVLANVYFAGFTNCTQLPSVLYFAQYNTAAVAGYLRGATVAALTLAQIQALSGTLTLTIDGVSHVSATINLSAATSFSNAATLIQTGLDAGTPTTTATVTYDSLRAAFVITSSTTGAASAVSVASTSALATGLNLTAATGAAVSPGAVAAVPATLMNTVVGVTQNWATFMTVSEQTLSNKEAFAAWVQTTNQRWLYVCQDSDVNAIVANNTTCFGYVAKTAAYNGVMPVYDNSGTGVIAALQTAIAAATNFSQQNGRTTFAFRGQAGLTPQITNQTIYQTLIANGYNCYASFATATQQFTQNQPGQLPGAFNWADTYIDQVYFNAAFQSALMNLLASVPAVPYVTRGYSLIRAALLGTIKAMLNFGAAVSGVTLTPAQQLQIINATNDTNSVSVIQNTGYYLQILDPGAIVRGERGSPVINFFYTDGGSVQTINMSSVDVL